MDFISGLRKSLHYDTILVVVDWLTKYSHFIPLTHPYTANDVAAAVVNHVLKLHGFPKTVSDRDKLFMSHFLQELFKLSGTILKFSLAYHLEMDGQTEVVNRTLETHLRCFLGEKPKQWVKWLP